MIDIPTEGNEKLERIQEYVEEHEEIEQYWTCSNTIAVERLEMNDHGKKHIEIVTNYALQLLRLLEDHRTPGIVEDYDMAYEDAEVVVLLAGLLHDVGHIIHRYNHSEYSLAIADGLIEDLVEDMYDPREQVIIKSEVLHAIQSHHKKANPLTLEAGILRVADSLDVEKGRAKAPHAKGSISIHSISALSIEDVTVEQGEETPVVIQIEMSNSSGIFQLDELIKKKMEGSGIEDLIALTAEVKGDEKSLIEDYRL